MKSYDLIGCGALNLDLIYRLPADSPLWRELPPPGAEQAITAELRARVDAALAGIEPTRSGGGQAANTSFALARLGFSSAMLGRIGADDDGKPALPAIECPIQVAPPPGAPSVSINVVLNIERLKLDRFGEYSIDLALDGRHEGSIPLYMRQMS